MSSEAGRGRGGRGGAPRGGGRGGSRGRGGRGGKGGDDEVRAKVSTTRREEAEIRELEARIADEGPLAGEVDAKAKEFTELPLSRYTRTGLERGKFRVMTQMQRIAIPHALAGRDVLGAAKTGSGKTLAFVVPVLERLYRERWTGADGLGALIVSPTRELALQIFEVVRTVGSAHFGLSAGVICGGKPLEEEAAGVGSMALLVATPGRLLQHLEQTAGFSASELRVLVLDEADRLLDLGFRETLNAILAYLPGPPQRQTLLFSATQTKSVKDLARLSLSAAPEYLAVHEAATAATPAKLAQAYVVCGLPDKLNLLFSFIRTHVHAKVIVFVSSCKQGRFVFEAFRRLRPGVPLQLLHGKMKQQRRMLVYYDFLKKPAAVLFATDVAARGLDFPGVDWVVQLDCPEDAESYIHRVGRTARHHAAGNSLLVLLPSEAPAMLPLLAEARIPLKQTHVAPAAAISITGKLAAEVAADADLKQLAQRAFSSYMRSVYLQPNKAVFNLPALPAKEFAASLGLAVAPVLKISAAALALPTEEARAAVHARKNENKALGRLKESIAKAKAEKRAAAAAAAAAAAGGGGALPPPARSAGGDRADDEETSEDDSDEGSDEDDDDSDSGSSGSSGDDDGASEAGAGSAPPARSKVLGGGLLHPRSSGATTAAAAEAAGGGALAGVTAAEEAAALEGLSGVHEARVRRILRDTQALAAGGDARRGADGLTPFQRIAVAKARDAAAADAGAAPLPPPPPRADPAAVRSAAETYAARVAARLASAARSDWQHERERVQAKHKEAKRAAAGDADDEREEQKVGYTLGGGGDDEDEEEGGADADDDDDDDDSDDDEGGEEEDDDDDDDSESDGVEVGAAEPKRVLDPRLCSSSAVAGSKRARGGAADSGRADAADPPDLEGAALALLQKRKAVRH